MDLGVAIERGENSGDNDTVLQGVAGTRWSLCSVGECHVRSGAVTGEIHGVGNEALSVPRRGPRVCADLIAGAATGRVLSENRRVAQARRS